MALSPRSKPERGQMQPREGPPSLLQVGEGRAHWETDAAHDQVMGSGSPGRPGGRGPGAE